MVEEMRETAPRDDMDDAPMNARAEIIEDFRARANFLRMLGKWFYEPLSEADVAALSASVFRDLAETTPDALMAEGYNDMYRYLRRANTGTREDLNVDFTRAFMGTATFHGMTASPYASLFLNPGGQMMGQARNEARAFYRESGIKLGDGIDLPEDHLAFELEFLAILADRCADALKAEDDEAAIELIERAATFLDGHVLTWVGRLFDLSVELVRTRFYRGVVKVARGYLESELETLAFLREEVRGLAGVAGKADETSKADD